MKIHQFVNGRRFEVRPWGPRRYAVYVDYRRGDEPLSTLLRFAVEKQDGRRATYGVQTYTVSEAGVPTGYKAFGSQGCRSLQAVLEEIAQILNKQEWEALETLWPHYRCDDCGEETISPLALVTCRNCGRMLHRRKE